MATEKEMEQELVEIGQAVERLRVHYQQFFMGLEKRPPSVMRDQLERKVRHSALNDVRRANLKFRFQTVIQKFRTYEVYWDRIQRDIEEGRFSRELFGRDAPRDEGSVAGPLPSSSPLPEGAEPREPEPEPGPPSSLAQPQLPRDPMLPQDPVHRLFVAYLDARESLGLPVDGITEPSFRAGLEKQREIQAARLGVPEVAFEVAVKEGKVILLARPVVR